MLGQNSSLLCAVQSHSHDIAATDSLHWHAELEGRDREKVLPSWRSRLSFRFKIVSQSLQKVSPFLLFSMTVPWMPQDVREAGKGENSEVPMGLARLACIHHNLSLQGFQRTKHLYSSQSIPSKESVAHVTTIKEAEHDRKLNLK